jgi:dTDP-4-amino-4,6-dideoxygalactose transaminase
MAVPFADVGRAVGELRAELDDAIRGVLDSGRFILGAEVRSFEREFAEACHARHAIAVASGTDAIELALRAAGVGPGDEVITQANTCVPTVAAIQRAGAVPVLCDAESEAGTLEPASLEAAITSRTRAVVPVHLYGHCAQMDPILAIARRHNLVVVEDCAQAHGAEYRGRYAGTMGALGCFSFYPTKNLGALGDGGAVITDDDELAARVRMLRQYGQPERDHSELTGVNSRLDEIQAAVLRVKLRRLAAWNARRRQIAQQYEEALAATPATPLAELPGHRHSRHLYVVKAPVREAFRAELQRRGVATLVHYPVPIHQQPAYHGLAEGPVSLANAERLAGEIVSLPLYPQMSDAEVEYVAAAAQDAARGRRRR